MNTPIKNGGSAFPFAKEMETISGLQFSTGMSLRDYFAGQALKVTLFRPGVTFFNATREAYQIADAMIEAREAQQ